MSRIDYPEAISYNGRQLEEGDFSREMIARLVEEWQATHPPLKIDGCCGPKTQASIYSEIPPRRVPEKYCWDPWDGPMEEQPRNRAGVYQIFGTPGDASSAWAKQHIVESHGSQAFPGVPPKWYVKIHREVEPYAREGLRRANLSSPYRIDRCGGYVYRRVQYDEANPLSYHASGIALDFDSNRNYAKRFPEGDGPQPWSPKWMKIWPHGIDEPFVRAMSSCGWSWGGWWRYFVDPMHFEWVGDADV
ncbi:MAG: M15 family metallopeptidase [Deltaproteobacteria bacterium]|nr:M15 family metallopeptidase [Deltaproteobacteria bacterium]